LGTTAVEAAAELNLMQLYPKHYCGVFGIYGHPNAAELTYYGLYALQHRGQESAGIVSCDGTQFREYKRMGLVSQIFNAEVLHNLAGHMAVGHTRYSTTGSSHLRNAQPLTGDSKRGQLAIAHNGNLTTPPPCASSWRIRARFFKQQWTAKSSCTSFPSRTRAAAKITWCKRCGALRERIHWSS